MSANGAEPRSDVLAIARAFVEARRTAQALADFPGKLPEDLQTAYSVQEAALGLRQKRVVGWKVALVRPDFRDRYRAERIAGPVLEGTVFRAGDIPVEAPVFQGGFAAVEAEFAFHMGEDLPPRAAPYSREEVAAAAGSLHIAMEIASSPLPTLNDLGPAAVVSDQGNNAGLLVGASVPGWSGRAPDSLPARMSVDGRVVGEGSAASVPGGPVAALLFLANDLRERGRGLRAGDWISSGATTGIHAVRPGASVLAQFGEFGTIEARIVPVLPETD